MIFINLERSTRSNGPATQLNLPVRTGKQKQPCPVGLASVGVHPRVKQHTRDTWRLHEFKIHHVFYVLVLGRGLVYRGLTPQQQPGSYQGGEMMMKSVFWWRKPEYPEETTDLRQVTDETFTHTASAQCGD